MTWLPPWLDALAGDGELAGAFSAEAELDALLRVEAALAEAQATLGVVPASAAKAIGEACRAFAPDRQALIDATLADGVVVPELVRQLRAAVGGDAAAHVHRGATSQDIVDTGLALRLGPVLTVFEQRLQLVVDRIDSLSERFGAEPLMGRTRMRAAVPIRVADRLNAWREPLVRLRDGVPASRPELLRVQLGGPVGTREGLHGHGDAVADGLADALGLHRAAHARHTDRHGVVAFADFLSHVTGALGKIGQDVALMAQDGIDAIRLSGTGGSSAMAHKQNPVKAELLVTLARYNAVQVSAMHQALVHEQERSGAAWTLEWLVLPPMVRTTGASTALAQALLDSVEHMGEGVE